jgi:ElaB/YqjD/DUF883 family membrane-anchored ribosome-binding protein
MATSGFMQQGSETVVDNIKEMGAEARERAQQGFETLRHSAEDYFEQGREKALELSETMEQRIRSQPIAALAVAAGIGFLIGAIWSRR